MAAVEELQRIVWGAQEVVPYHLLLAAIHNGGLLLGAYEGARLAGFVFGFPGFSTETGRVVALHISHMLAVHPEAQSRGLGFALKRAQWQMVRHQGLDLITWTYDPLLSRNAHLNITRLGAIAKTYYRDFYGEMNDNLNAGLPSDRLLVEVWVRSPRVTDRMRKRPRPPLDLAHYFSAGANILNPSQAATSGWPHPAEAPLPPLDENSPALFLVEIPADFQALRAADQGLARAWRLHLRELLESLFAPGYLITDFVYLAGESPRSFYVLSDGQKTFGS